MIRSAQKLVFVAAMGLFGWVGSASSQVRSMPPDPYDPRGQAAPAASASYPALNNYPAAEVQAVPTALAQAAAARVKMGNSQRALHLIVDELKEDFETSSQLLVALRQEKQAYDAYQLRRRLILAAVWKNPEYQTLKHLAADLKDRVQQLQDHAGRNHAELLATAELKLAYSSQISQMEADALLADSAIDEARTNLLQASEKVSALRSAFSRSVRRDQNFVAAKADYESSRVARLATAAMLDGAVEARDIALDYAYYVNRHDAYRYPYSPYSGVYDSIYGGNWNYPVSSVIGAGYSRYRSWR